jgi:cysteine desulfurase/selenocysteine lyase
VVDAIQIVGTEPLDVRREDVDFLCCGTYKWLMSGWGVAPFYVRRELLDRIEPDRYGWQTALAAPIGRYEYAARRTAAKFEYGSPAFDQFQTLSAAIDYLLGIGLDRIHAQSRRQLADVRSGLVDLGFEVFTPSGNVGPTLTFWVGSSADEVDATFKARGVHVGFASGSRTSETYSRGDPVCRVRISPAHYNDDSDLQRFLDVCADLERHTTRHGGGSPA